MDLEEALERATKTEEVAWVRMPIPLREKAVNHLRSKLGESFLDDVRTLVAESDLGRWHPPGFHFGQGMWIRNLLRQVIPDSELPAMNDIYGDDGPEPIQNWDDYYIPCIEAAAGLREIEMQLSHVNQLIDMTRMLNLYPRSSVG